MTVHRASLRSLACLVAWTLVGCGSSSKTPAPDGGGPGLDGGGPDSAANDGGPRDAAGGVDASSVVDAGPLGYCALVAAGTPPDAGMQCNTLNPCDAPDVVIQNVSGQAPTALGGAITQGTYHLSMWQIFDGNAAGDGGVSPTVKHLRSIYVFGPGTAQLVTLDPTDQVHTQNVTYVTGGQLTVAPTCPAATGGPESYTATSTQVTLYGNDSGHVSLSTYTIVP